MGITRESSHVGNSCGLNTTKTGGVGYGRLSRLHRYGMVNCMPVSTLLSAKANFDPTSPEEHSTVSSYPYIEVIGSLMYVALGIRPDICSAIRALAPFAATFGHDHIKGLKHIMQYLAGCMNCSIMYTMGNGELVGYTDADWANNHSNC